MKTAPKISVTAGDVVEIECYGSKYLLKVTRVCLRRSKKHDFPPTIYGDYLLIHKDMEKSGRIGGISDGAFTMSKITSFKKLARKTLLPPPPKTIKEYSLERNYTITVDGRKIGTGTLEQCAASLETEFGAMSIPVADFRIGETMRINTPGEDGQEFDILVR